MLKLSPSFHPPPCAASPDPKQLHALSLKTATFALPSTSSKLISLYADPKTSNLDYALSVFDRAPKPTLLSWNVIIKCHVENHRSHDAISLFCELLHEFTPDSFTLPCVIKGCSRLGVVEEGKQLHGLAMKIGLGTDKFVQSSLVSMYAKCHDIGSARNVFDEMPEKDLVSWNSLIDGYARCGEVDLALEVFNEMPEKDCFSWTALVDGFSKCGKVDTAREIFDSMPNRNLVSWNAMINGYMKSGDSVNAACLFSQMDMRDLITWNSMIAGYDLNGKFKDAVDVFSEMLWDGFSPNRATLVSALSAVSGLATLSKGRWIHSYMVKNAFELDDVLGTSLIDMYSKCGSIESALAVFQSIQSKKLGHWTAIIVGLGMHGMAGEALHLFSKMRRAGLKPNGITFIGVLNACNHAGLVDHGRCYFEMMRREYGIEPTIEHFGCLVDLLCRAGRIKEAKNVIDGMPMKPNKIIWMSLLSGSRIQGNISIGEYAAHKLIEIAPETISCYILLSNMYAAAGHWEKVSQVREMMKSKGISKDPGCSSIEHQGTLHEFIVGDKSHGQTRQIYWKLGEMREKLKKVGHVPDTSQVLLCIEGEEEKEAELETHSERLAIAFGLISIEPGIPIRIMKNLRVCNDCHSVTKLLSKIYNREITVRDNSRFHHFRNGSCSCNDFW
ncbi:pentatricopeptide repeat-containing protein At2g29760, chloroplastic-like [Punica granatum]|uniref:Uncharacterized protein n=2 Tax=Punica granatum TaxID=22663 RepID=A0A2I0K6P7_PUNGR|nr:pentatricopeptide repeat-containing protein At2g29760, chloroplastic-like [Punica granatum]PKI64231.1 hypothetical protein CRG98_015418 [Punica granatum]